MDRSPEFVIGFFVGLAIVAALTAISYFVIRKKRGAPKYDERQQIIRCRAYRSAFWTLVAYLCLTGMFSVATGMEWADAMTGPFIGIAIAVTVFVVISISGDAYFGVSEKPGFYLVLFAVLILVNGAVAAMNLAHGVSFLTDGRLNFHCMNFIVLLMFITVFAALAVKAISRRRHDGAE